MRDCVVHLKSQNKKNLDIQLVVLHKTHYLLYNEDETLAVHLIDRIFNSTEHPYNTLL